MIATLSRYVARRFFTAFFLAFTVVFTLVVLVNLVELVRDNASGRADFGDILTLSILMTPTIAITALPFVVLLAAMVSFSQLARSSELVVTRAAGVSVWRLIAPAVIVGLLIGAASFALLNPVAAAMRAKFETLEARYFDGRSSQLSVGPEGLWLRQGQREEQTVIHATGSNSDATELTDVTLFEFDKDASVIAQTLAKTAMLDNGVWRLNDARVLRFDPTSDGDGVAESFYAVLETPTDLDRTRILDSFASPDTISFWDLPRFIRTLERSGFSATRHRLHWQGLMAAPLLFGAMVMVGAVFSMRSARFGGLGAMALGCVVTGFAVYFITDVTKALGASGSIPVMIAAWAPPAAATLFAAGLLLQLEDG